MSNGFDKAFAQMIGPRIEATRKEEASHLVLEGMRVGRRLGDAVADVIEMLPAGKTKRLRAWTAQLDAFHEWLGFEHAGWSLERLGAGFFPRPGQRIVITAPSDEEQEKAPPDYVVAAAVNAGAVRYVGKNKELEAVIYEVIRAA